MNRRALWRRLALACGLWMPLAGRAASEVRPWPAGRRAPPLALGGLDGRPWRLSDLKGRVVVLNFWATWCEPCRAEMPSLQFLAQRHAQDGRLVVLAVNYQEHEARVRRFLEATGLQLSVALDRDGAAAKAWTRRIFPTTVIIDASGRPRFTVTGEYDWAAADADRLIAPLLKAARR
ncbi:MAG: TlpA family protein disulfide reductase [Ramlibacter sp.]|nr:TlpA family protein disulfide reductase [Ramlibacter sp.]